MVGTCMCSGVREFDWVGWRLGFRRATSGQCLLWLCSVDDAGLGTTRWPPSWRRPSHVSLYFALVLLLIQNRVLVIISRHLWVQSRHVAKDRLIALLPSLLHLVHSSFFVYMFTKCSCVLSEFQLLPFIYAFMTHITLISKINHQNTPYQKIWTPFATLQFVDSHITLFSEKKNPIVHNQHVRSMLCQKVVKPIGRHQRSCPTFSFPYVALHIVLLISSNLDYHLTLIPTTCIRETWPKFS